MSSWVNGGAVTEMWKFEMRTGLGRGIGNQEFCLDVRTVFQTTSGHRGHWHLGGI